MCLNMMRRIIDELFGKFTIKLTPKKINKKMSNVMTSVWTSPTFDPHLDHMWHHWYICDAAGVSLKQRFQKNSLKFSCKLPSNYELKLPVSQIKKVAFEQSEK